MNRLLKPVQATSGETRIEHKKNRLNALEPSMPYGYRTLMRPTTSEF
jgi:hypothetical protein